MRLKLFPLGAAVLMTALLGMFLMSAPGAALCRRDAQDFARAGQPIESFPAETLWCSAIPSKIALGAPVPSPFPRTYGCEPSLSLLTRVLQSGSICSPIRPRTRSLSVSISTCTPTRRDNVTYPDVDVPSDRPRSPARPTLR